MVTGPTDRSDDEIIKRLQILMRGVANAHREDASDLVRIEGDLREGRTLAEELAFRIYADPAKWGLADVPEDARTDVAADTLVHLLLSIGEFRGQQSTAEWFAAEAQAYVERVQVLQEQATDAQEGESGKRSKRKKDGIPEPSQVFSTDIWAGFERESPREAFTLRLRHMLNRDSDEMVEILEAPTPRAVTMRLNRARDRFGRYCREHGVDARTVEQVLQELGEGQRR